MKSTKPTGQTKVIDRISKAVLLIEQGKVYQQGNGTFRVLADSFVGGYSVTVSSCDCLDFEQRQARDDASPCKHQWAAIGATAAMLIDAIRKATTTSTLEATAKQYADAMATLPDVFKAIARAEYRKRYDALVAAIRNDDGDDLQILIKPQPKSNGTYGGGIEI